MRLEQRSVNEEARALLAQLEHPQWPRILITGSRTWVSATSIRTALERLLAHYQRITVVHGDCPRGADAMASRWAKRYRSAVVQELAVPAPWGTYGNRAGNLRNGAMVNLGAHMVLVFAMPCEKRKPWCPPGEHPSHGTADCVQKARDADLMVKFSPEGLAW